MPRTIHSNPEPEDNEKIKNWINFLRSLVQQIQTHAKPEEIILKCMKVIEELESIFEIDIESTDNNQRLLKNKDPELLLKQSSAIFHNIQLGIYIYHLENMDNDASLRMVNANPEAESVTGIKNINLIGKTIDECFPGLRERNVPHVYAEVIRNQTPVELGDFFYDRDGVHPKYYSVKAFPLPGNNVGIFFNDITPMKAVIDALEESESKYRLLTENISDIVFSLDEGMKFTYLSPAIKNILGYDPEECYGKPILNFISSDTKENMKIHLEKSRDEWLKGINVRVSSKSEICLIRKDEGLVWIEVHTSGILDTKNKIIGYNGIARDITEQKDYEEKLRNAKEKAEVSDKLKSAFLANMSHEIRTPMNGILGFASMLNREDLPKDRKEKYLGFINSSTKQLLTIINDIIDISRIEAGQLKIIYSDIDLRELIEEVFENIEAERKYRNKLMIEIKINIPVAGDIKIWSDEIRIKQVFINLLNNSLKFTEEGYIELGYTLEKNDNVIFFVKDTGIGISSEYRTKIFNRFSQGSEIGNAKYGGTGLGLAISKGIVELLGGNIWFTSEKGTGSEFYFSIPLTQGEERKSIKQKSGETGNEDWSDKKILVVEDDLISIEYIKESLKSTGVKLDIAKTGEKGLELFEENKDYHLVLMDLRLPGLDGYETIKRMKSINKNIPVVVQTANVMTEQRQKAFNSGCNDFISKPIDRKIFFSVIAQYMR